MTIFLQRSLDECIFKHSFYRQIPYEYAKGHELSEKQRKPKSLSAIATEMKGWTACNY